MGSTPTRKWVAAAGILSCLALALLLPTAGSAVPSCTGTSAAHTIAYERLPGVPANATSLDVYKLSPSCPRPPSGAPVVVWVHGGGYHTGDKSNQIAAKRKLFNGNGYVFISVNYRLTRTGIPSSAHYPDHYRDLAAAIAWTHAHVSSWGGNPRRIAVLGHSAGADIVANVTTNARWLRDRSLFLGSVRCAGTLDTAGFDKTRVPDASAEAMQWKDALGNDAAYKQDTSATLLAKAGAQIPRTITVVRGTPLRRSIQTAYVDRLRSLGIGVSTIDASSLSHAEVNSRIGAPGDTVMTPPLMHFLSGCFNPGS
ncbi:MAG TPA: alpha/beta hydrolase [Solirubrobacterales bacterium]|jgi:acetyl esterase/lipase